MPWVFVRPARAGLPVLAKIAAAKLIAFFAGGQYTPPSRLTQSGFSLHRAKRPQNSELLCITFSFEFLGRICRKRGRRLVYDRLLRFFIESDRRLAFPCGFHSRSKLLEKRRKAPGPAAQME